MFKCLSSFWNVDGTEDERVWRLADPLAVSMLPFLHAARRDAEAAFCTACVELDMAENVDVQIKECLLSANSASGSSSSTDIVA